MFEADRYRKACSESLKLPEEKLQEMIFMTENKKRGLRKPVQIALIAAALVCVMCVTAAAANPEAVQKLWKSFSISVLYEGGNTVMVQADMPEVCVERAGERVVLTVDDVKTDITEVLEHNGVYKQTFENEIGTAELTVKSDLSWEMNLSMEDGREFSYNSERFELHYPADWDTVLDVTGEESQGFLLDPADDAVVTYTFTDDESVTGAIYLPPEE